MSELPIETHPLQPFLPENAKWLFLGSFPPPQARWSMLFFYPNFINDFWRIMGYLFFDDREHFVVKGETASASPSTFTLVTTSTRWASW